jgi:hypothetical protein
MKTRSVLLCLFFALSLPLALAKTEPNLVMLWPPEKPALKLTFEKFRQVGNYVGQSTFVSETTVQNLTNKKIPRASFTVYLMDKNDVRIGDGLQVSDLEAGQSAKIQFQASSVGIPVHLVLSAKKDMLSDVKTIPLKVISVPSGANLKVDGQVAGITPVIVRLTVGSHSLDLAKEGYAPGNTPLEVTSDELPGGSVTVELGGLSRDTVELRDGTILLGDVVSVSLTSVIVRVDGNEATCDRNRIKKIILVEREVHEQPAAIGPASTQSQ